MGQGQYDKSLFRELLRKGVNIMSDPNFYVHPTAEVSKDAVVGKGTRIWNHVQIREDARVGDNCIIGKGVYIDFGVVIGSNVKIQNDVNLYHGTVVEDDVFVGPTVCFTNDKIPRAVTPSGRLKTKADWSVGRILVKRGASIGGCSVILPNVTIGRFAMIGAGSVVTHDVPDYGLAYGNPASLRGYVCECGGRLTRLVNDAATGLFKCTVCGERIIIEGSTHAD